ncbi:helix-hairpin-helix domain-containing protein [Kribbella sp. HUAS MG21]|uniref:Helix-hairpin-helix domain-containing protein n=1 Tax=Kribbella sp. HUAS MG21 TaxID=3160966 RepID=A0AAU7TDK5_9ACTN
MKVFRRIPPPDPDARARALARLAARPAPHAHAPDNHLHIPNTRRTLPPTPIATAGTPTNRSHLTDAHGGAPPAAARPQAEDLEEREEVRGGWIPNQPDPDQPSPGRHGPERPGSEHFGPERPDPERPVPGRPDPERPGGAERLRDARWTLTPRHVGVLALLLAVGLAWAAWTFLRARPEPVPDTRPTTAATGTPVAQPSTQPGPGSAQTQPRAQHPPGTAQPPGAGQSPGLGPASAQAHVVVHVAGKVRRPGLVRAPAGSRVADVLGLAGGALRGVDLTSLNLARQVVDGEQIVVGQPTNVAPPTAPPTGAASTPVPNTPVNLNAATLAELDALPGVGPVLAQRILDYRTQNGPFTTIDQLQEVPGVGPKKFDSLKPHVRI